MNETAAARWTRLVANRRSGPGPQPGRGEGPPAGMVAGLRAASRRDMTRTPLFQAVAAALGPERSVLDLGAGTGRYTVPLARAGCRVWALEPSGVMRQALAEELAALSAEDAERVRVVPEAWPAGRASAPPVEVALASLVVHFSEDAVAFLQAMEAAATRRCVVGIRAAQMHPLSERLWPRFRPDRPFPAQPVLADLLEVLREMGVEAEAHVHESARPYGRYANPEDARAEAARALGLSEPDDLARLDAELSSLLVPAEDGWRVDTEPVREAVVSWTPRAR